MKEWDLATDFLLAFEADPIFADRTANRVTAGNCVNAQSSVDFARPAYVFHIRARALDARGFAFAYTLTIDVQSEGMEVDDDGARVGDLHHAERVAAVQRKLFGATAEDAAAAEDALTAFIAAAGRFTLSGYDAGTGEIDPAVQPAQFETPVMISGIARVT